MIDQMLFDVICNMMNFFVENVLDDVNEEIAKKIHNLKSLIHEKKFTLSEKAHFLLEYTKSPEFMDKNKENLKPYVATKINEGKKQKNEYESTKVFLSSFVSGNETESFFSKPYINAQEKIESIETDCKINSTIKVSSVNKEMKTKNV